MLKLLGYNEKEISKSKYEVDGVPPLGEAIPLGLQHIFAMFASNLTPLILVAGIVGITGSDLTLMLQCAMFVAAIATINQCYPLFRSGGKLPVVMGVSSGFIPTNAAIASGYGIAGLLGATFVGGLFCTVLGFFLKPLRRFFPSLVTGTVVLTIGLSLLPVAIRSMAGGGGAPDFGSPKNWIVALIVCFVVIALNQFTKGFTKTSSVLLGMIVGYIICIPLGMVKFDAVRAAGWFALPKPFHFPMEFKWGAILPMAVMFIVTTVETVGDVTAITMGGAGREATDRELSGSIINNGLSSSFAAIFGVLPTTSFSQNVGMVALTKIMSRFVVAVGAIFLLIAGLIPKLGALVSTIPASVVGGACLVIFAQITLTGIGILTSEPLTDRDRVIIGLSLAFGIGLTQVQGAMDYFPELVKVLFGGSGIVIACLVAMLLNVLIPQRKDEVEEAA